MDEAIKWLRQQVAQRLETARKACHGADGHWTGRQQTPYGPHGHLRDSLGEVAVYDEGSPSDEQFEHIALNDPQDVIARCEAELGILHLYGLWAAEDLDGNPALGAAACAVSDAVRHLASGYKHREGYAGHWGEA